MHETNRIVAHLASTREIKLQHALQEVVCIIERKEKEDQHRKFVIDFIPNHRSLGQSHLFKNCPQVLIRYDRSKLDVSASSLASGWRCSVCHEQYARRDCSGDCVLTAAALCCLGKHGWLLGYMAARTTHPPALASGSLCPSPPADKLCHCTGSQDPAAPRCRAVTQHQFQQRKVLCR